MATCSQVVRFFNHESIQVREYMMQQINSTDDDGLLMNIVIEGMICDTGRKVIDAFCWLEVVGRLETFYLCWHCLWTAPQHNSLHYSHFKAVLVIIMMAIYILFMIIINIIMSIIIFIMITNTQSEPQTWVRPCSWWGSSGPSLTQRTCSPGEFHAAYAGGGDVAEVDAVLGDQ